MAAKDELGRLGEELAARHLIAAGHVVLERNWRCRDGELDIVTRDGDTLVVVEVKTRAGLAFGHPIEAITRQKLGRLRRLAALWCRARGVHARDLRIDAVSVLAPRGADPVVEHFEAVA
jgi:putative endonuclease